jgi:hypothetical protein
MYLFAPRGMTPILQPRKSPQLSQRDSDQRVSSAGAARTKGASYADRFLPEPQRQALGHELATGHSLHHSLKLCIYFKFRIFFSLRTQPDECSVIHVWRLTAESLRNQKLCHSQQHIHRHMTQQVSHGRCNPSLLPGPPPIPDTHRRY